MQRTRMLVLATIAALATPALAPLYAQATGATLPVQASAKAKSKGPGKATARCSDGTWSKAASQQGACSAHGGVATWFGKKPRGATARCNDGQYWDTAERQGACSGHDGVAVWYKKVKGSAKKGG